MYETLVTHPIYSPLRIRVNVQCLNIFIFYKVLDTHAEFILSKFSWNIPQPFLSQFIFARKFKHCKILRLYF